MRAFLTGSEAVAQGVHECGAHLAAVCPGPVASEIAAALARLGAVRCEPLASEKAAVELALGAALAGGRAVAVVRAGGLQGASGALLAAASAGAPGLAVVACDDPSGRAGPAVDSRLVARNALLPVLEPADPAEARAFVEAALSLSERFGTPVVVRLTTRLADSAEPVALVPRRAWPPRGQRVETAARAAPDGAAAQRARALERLAALAAHGGDTALNRTELRSEELGVVVSGLAYGMVREALPEASVLKLGLVHPLPTGLVRDFARRVRRLQVVEEAEPFLEGELRAAGIACRGKDRLGWSDTFTPALLALALDGRRPPGRPPEPVPQRPAELCPGCPHRATLHALKLRHVTVTGDLDCAWLGTLAPLSPVARAPGRGASVAVEAGTEAALGARRAGRAVALIGDQAFLHSGTGGLAAAATLAGTVVVADASGGPEAMGGGAELGVHATGGRRVDLEALVRAMGIEAVRVVDPLHLEATGAALRQELDRQGPSVVVARSPCVQLRGPRAPHRVEPARCNRCGACLRLGCPAASDGPETVVIDPAVCAGCGLCAQVCRARAIEPVGLA